MLEVTFHVYFSFCLFAYRFLLKPGFAFLASKMTNLGLQAKEPLQHIEFPIKGGEKSAAVVAENVVVFPSPGDHSNGSSKVKLSNIVDYSWEDKFYPGQLLAVHMSGTFVAYGIKGNNFAVRVVNRDSGKRALIKGFRSMIEDLAFAFIPNQITLACVEEMGDVYVHNVFEDHKDIAASLVLHIIQTAEVTVPKRVFWCPFVPDDVEDQDPFSDETALLLAITRDKKLEIWNVASASSSTAGPMTCTQSPGSSMMIEAHDGAIVSAAFSPDGTAIATASADGECKFFQSEGDPTCLHRWKPHGGKPVTTLFFLDDHKTGNPDTKFWKYAVTGTENNTELKIWTCETWKCLQTIRFTSKGSKRHFQMKAAVDLSSNFIFLSEMSSKLLFILELDKGDDETIPYVKTITEFTFPCAILSYAIVNACYTDHHIKSNNVNYVEELTNGEDEDAFPSIKVRMYFVQPKSLQECHISFETHSAVTQTSPTNFHNNELSDEVPNNIAVDTSHNAQPSINLMTPDAFHSPHADSNLMRPRTSATPAAEPLVPPYPGNLVLPNGEPPSDTGGGERRKGFVSGGSTPSREVEEILSLMYPGETVTHIPKPLAQSKYSEVNDRLIGIEKNLQGLQSDVKTLCHTVNLQMKALEKLQEEISKSRHTSMQDVEGAITNAVSTYKPVSEIDIVNSITPLISQAVLTIVNPAVIKSMSDLHNMVHNEVGAKLTSTDVALKESISKIVKSKAFVDMLTRTISSAASQAMEPVFRESFTRIVVPMFEAACVNMFSQINDRFTKGVNETISAFNEQAKAESAVLKKTTEGVTQATHQFTSTVEKETKSLEETMLEIERRLKVCMNGASVRSSTVTPAPHIDPHVIQSQLSMLIKQGQYNIAFQQALSASDLSLVTYVCERIDIGRVFTRSGCILQQHVLLSLIQQLAADMSSHTDIKQRYLEGAVMNLLPSNENTREHMPQVLTQLQKQLIAYSTATSDPSLAYKAKLLAMACQQLVRNVKEDWD